MVLRYVFSLGWVWMQESYVWLHGLVFMLGAGYSLLHNGHVRVDIFYRPAGPRAKAWVDLLGSLLLGLVFEADLSSQAEVVLGVGLCGSLTTFSAFADELRHLGVRRGAAYTALTVACCSGAIVLATAVV